MTLPASGPISAQAINVEFGRGATSPIPLGADFVRAYAGIMSGPIRFSDFYGRSAYVPMTAQGYGDIEWVTGGYNGSAVLRPYVVVRNGAGGYAYNWSFTSNRGMVLSNATQSQCTVTKTFSRFGDQEYFSTLQCEITDGTGQRIVVSGIEVELYVDDPNTNDM